jgi:hypothetical protein
METARSWSSFDGGKVSVPETGRKSSPRLAVSAIVS